MAARFAAAYPQRVRSLTLASIAVGNAHLSEVERMEFITQRLADLIALGPRAMAEKRGPSLRGPQATAALSARGVDTMEPVGPDEYTKAANMMATGDGTADVARLGLRTGWWGKRG